MKNNNSISMHEYLNKIYDKAKFYNSSNNVAQWAQYTTVKSRALALAKVHFEHYTQYNDTEGIKYAKSAIRQISSI